MAKYELSTHEAFEICNLLNAEASRLCREAETGGKSYADVCNAKAEELRRLCQRILNDRKQAA